MNPPPNPPCFKAMPTPTETELRAYWQWSNHTFSPIVLDEGWVAIVMACFRSDTFGSFFIRRGRQEQIFNASARGRGDRDAFEARLREALPLIAEPPPPPKPKLRSTRSRASAETKLKKARVALQVIHTWASFEGGRALDPANTAELTAKTLEEIR